MGIKDKVAIVTGAASGIGKEIAQTFARAGAKVCIADVNMEAAEAVGNEIEKEGGAAMAVAMDVANEEAVDSSVQKVIDYFGGVDILISNAGIQIIDSVVDFSFANWKKVLAIQLDGGFLTARACLRHMKKSGQGGSIVFMGSVHSKEASPLKAPYVTAKHGLLGLCRVIAKEGAGYGVRANVICPGFVLTPLVEKQIPEQAAELGISEEDVVRKVMLGETVDGQFTTTADVAQVALFLCSFPTNALTGQSVIVSHGWFME